MRPTFKNFYIEWITILMVLCSTAAQFEVPPPEGITLHKTMDHLHLNRSFLPKNLPKSNKVLSGIPIPTGIPLPTFSPITLTETSTRSFLDELNLVNINNNKQLSVQNQGSTGNFNSPSQSGQSSGAGYGSYGSGNALGQPSVPVFNQQPTSGNFGNGPSAFNNGQNYQGQSNTGFGMSIGNNQQQQSGYGANTGNIQQQQPQQQQPQQQQPQQQQQQQQLQQPIQTSGFSGGANFGGPSSPMGQFGQSFSPSPASNPQFGSMMNQGSSYGGPSDQGQRQNAFGPVTAQNNVQPGSGGSYSGGLPAVSSGQFGPVGAGPQMVPNSASQSYSGGAPAQIPMQQFPPPASSSSGSYGGGSPMQSGIQNSQQTGFQNSQQTGFQNFGQQAPSAGFTVSSIAQPLAPLTGFTAAPVTPSAAFNQIQGSNQLASGFASSLPAALSPLGQNIGSSSGLNNGFFQTGNNPQSQNFNNQLGNNQQQTQSSYGGASGNAQFPVVQQQQQQQLQQQQSSFPSGQLPQQYVNPVQQPIEPSGYGIGTPSVSPSFGQSGYGNSVSQPVPQPQPQFFGTSPQSSFNSPPAQGPAIQSYGSSFPQGEVYGGPGTAQLNPMVGQRQPSYGGMSSSPQSGYGQSGNNINRPNSSGAGNVPFGGSGGNQAGGYGLGNQGANQNFGGSSGGNGGVFATGSNNAGQGGQNSGFAASIPNGQGLQGTTQSLFNNPSQQQGQSGSNLQNQQLGSNLQNQNLVTTTPFSGFGGLASLAASLQQQLGTPTNTASSGSSNSIGATPSSAISPNQVQQQQTGQQNPLQGQLNNQQVNNQQLTNQQNSNPNQLNGGLTGNQLNQQGFPSTSPNQNQLNGGLSGNQGNQQGLLPVNGNQGSQQGSGLGGNQQNQQNINQLNQVPQNIGGNTGNQLYG